MSESPVQTDHILRNNLLGVLVAAVVLGAFAPLTEGSIAIVFAMVYGVQVLFNLLLGAGRLINPQPGRSAAPYFLSALLVLLTSLGNVR